MKQKCFILGFILPALILTFLFLVLPMFNCLYLATSHWPGFGEPTPLHSIEGKNWYDNFVIIFNDKYFWQSIINTIVFVIVSTLGTVIFGLLLALVLKKRGRGWKFYRVFWYMPVTLSFVIVGMLWTNIYDTSGLLNKTIESIPPLASLASSLGWETNFNWLRPPHNMIFISCVAVWQYSGFPMIVILAGLDDISDDVYEAALIDGASEWRQLWSITLPMLKHVLFTITFVQIIFAFRVFDLVFVMAKGWDSQVIASYMYMMKGAGTTGFSLSAAVGIIILFVGVLMSIGYVAMIKRIEANNG